MTLIEAFEIRAKIATMLMSKDRAESATAQVLLGIINNGYRHIEDAEEDIKFLSETN